MQLIVSVKNLTCNVRNASEKAHFVSKVTFVVLYVSCMQIISVSREVALPHFEQFLHELSTTMFVLIKNLDYRKNKGFVSAI